jgi:pantothenate kinase
MVRLLEADPWSAIRDLLDIAWFLDLDQDTRVRRLVARHEAYGKSMQAARAWVAGSDERNATLVAQSRLRADSIVQL